MELNRPLLCGEVAAGPRRGGSGEGSFLSVQGALVTAMKPAGFPVAGYDQDDRYGTGLALRLFRPHGESGQATIKTSLALAGAAAATPLEETTGSLQRTQGSIRVPCRSFGIHTALLDLNL